MSEQYRDETDWLIVFHGLCDTHQRLKERFWYEHAVEDTAIMMAPELGISVPEALERVKAIIPSKSVRRGVCG